MVFAPTHFAFSWVLHAIVDVRNSSAVTRCCLCLSHGVFLLQVAANAANRIDTEFGEKLDNDELKVALDELVSKS